MGCYHTLVSDNHRRLLLSVETMHLFSCKCVAVTDVHKACMSDRARVMLCCWLGLLPMCLCVSQVERLHYQLRVFVETARRGEPIDGRLMQHLLRHPSEDGGQWQMLVNLVNKYGVVPKKCFAEAWSSENSRRLALITNNKVTT